MAKVLYVKSSPRADRAYSERAADVFFEVYRAVNPNDEIETLDLWEAELPRFDGDILAAKYAVMRREDFTADQQRAWGEVEKIAHHFMSFDKFVFSVPMWNFIIPYVLKHYIDIIAQPGVTFGRTPEGSIEGFLKGKKVMCIYAAGSPYDEGSPIAHADFVRPYLKWIFHWIGIDDAQFEMVAPTTRGDEIASEALLLSTDRCRDIAKTF